MAVLLLGAACAACTSVGSELAPNQLPELPYGLIDGHERFLVDGEILRYRIDLLFLKVAGLEFESRLSDGPEPHTLRVSSITAPTPLAALLSRYGGRTTSWFDIATLRPRRYVWTGIADDEGVTRRYNEFHHEEGFALGLEIRGNDWEYRRFEARIAQDPLCFTYLVRVIDLEPGEGIRFDLFEGTGHRRCSILCEADEELGVGGPPVIARRFAIRVDKLDDGELVEERPPESDMKNWVSLDDRRVVLRSRGRMGGLPITVDLVERRVEVSATETRPISEGEPD